MDRSRLTAAGAAVALAACAAALWTPHRGACCDTTAIGLRGCTALTRAAVRAPRPEAAQWLLDNSAVLLVGLALMLFLSSKQDVARVEAAVRARARSVAFSSVSQTCAVQLMLAAKLTLVDGDDAELARARARHPDRVDAFVWPARASEAEGTPEALKHIRKNLQMLGVPFGAGGYTLLDMHTRTSSLALCVGSMRFTGGVDGAIVPFSVAPLSAPNHARVVIELKRRSARAEGLGDSAVGQCLAELLGVNAQAAYPCILLLTDGAVCDVLRLRGELVARWQSVTLAEALAYVADFLLSESSPALKPPPGARPRVDPVTAATLQRLQQLAPAPGGGALAAAAEQLESLLAAEGVDVDTEEGAARRDALAAELAAHWRHAVEPRELPQDISHLFT